MSENMLLYIENIITWHFGKSPIIEDLLQEARISFYENNNVKKAINKAYIFFRNWNRDWKYGRIIYNKKQLEKISSNLPNPSDLVLLKEKEIEMDEFMVDLLDVPAQEIKKHTTISISHINKLKRDMLKFLIKKGVIE